MKIKDKIVLVTGGANGIGKALCERFHGEGAEKIYVADIDLENAEKVAKSVGGNSGQNLMFPTKKIANLLLMKS